MAADPPTLPTKFPCWCRAVYSWGGESKRDLGFVEGDLIECLNAGDGSWWMGRLRRDKRMMGLFPSNFVTVLGEDFVPVHRSTTDAVARADSDASATPKKQQTVFRKPFQAHKKAIAPGEANRRARERLSETPSNPPSRENTPPRPSIPLRQPRTPTTAIRTRSSLAKAPPHPVSPSPQEHKRTPSPVPAPPPPPQSNGHPSRSPSYTSPQPRSMSPLPARFAPPPPPPPHRVAVNSQSRRKSIGLPAPIDMNDRYAIFSKPPSPAVPSPDDHSLNPSPGHSPGGHSSVGHGNTPSPLRDAMEDVMTSLQDMGLPRGAPSPSPTPQLTNPWSPDEYNIIGVASPRPRPGRARANTSLGFGAGNEQELDIDDNYDGQQYSSYQRSNSPPQFNNYVQRMESRLRQLHEQDNSGSDRLLQDNEDDIGPPPPPKQPAYHSRRDSVPTARTHLLRGRKSAAELGKQFLSRTMTNKSSATNSSSGVQSVSTNETISTNTSVSLMSGTSAGAFSATSAGSFVRHGKWGSVSAERPGTAIDGLHKGAFTDLERSQTPVSGISYHSSHNTSRQGAQSAVPWSPGKDIGDSPGVFGGFATPKVKKSGFLKRFLESAKTGAANARSSIYVAQSGGSPSPTKNRLTQSFNMSQNSESETSRDMALGGSGSVDWVQVRRDVNRASTPSRNERVERAERCQMMDHPVIYAVEELHETAEGDETIDGLPLSEPTNWGALNLGLVDKSARFISSLPPMTNPASLAQGYVCRPYKSDVQRLRAIFIWVSEKISWDEPVDEDELDLRRVINMKRGSPREVAYLVKEMCAAVGLHADAIKGYLKTPGELFDLGALSRPNHWWNAVLIDGEWRIMDCSLANPTNPRRNQLVTTNSQHAESWYFLARPLEICYTHIPLHPEEQHICPPISPDVLLALPAASPAFFKNSLHMPDYDTSFVRIEGLEVMQLRILVPPDVECAAEVEVPSFSRDADGDWFESGDTVRKRALAQPDWIHGQKRFTIKAVLPGDEGQGVLRIYAGKKGLMHSIRDIPHPLAAALPIIHMGENPPYEFLLRHPTPHAQRHDIYVIQPQCGKLAINNTFVFAVRQHPAASLTKSSSGDITGGRASPIAIRPSSALSMVSSSYGGSVASTTSLDGFTANTSVVSSTKSGSSRDKPAKLAIQSPSGKILRLMRKADHMVSASNNSDSLTEGTPDGSVWETVIKIGERGVWRGLVLADRSARWCVFCEWECH
ncbi:putative SH3 domain protein [Talaromyces proteolyticus]|uniref:SH3 domain protein n=1 Tax=Talaromyces proteolyticus TaxID=1131652 RepID=A0AAD4KYF4_9EURO|nr:putative SH3 domain protein [Talaromyces proteolyticus]KAH8702108.1 putative SH3 domain protein [Talaromyces proteolyticus]